MTTPPAETRYTKRWLQVHGKRMAYIDVGEGDPIVFIHGNPTSSYLWRNVMPHLEGRGRLIAPDLIGMGDSDKLDGPDPDRYVFTEHCRYLFGLLDALALGDRVTLVLHDWGSALGFHWAHLHSERLRGIAFTEGFVRPMADWEAMPEGMRRIFRSFRSPSGERLILRGNAFIESVLPGAVIRPLGDAEMAEYRRPFLDAGEGRRAMLTWPRQIPIAGEPADVARIMGDYSTWLAGSTIPKLFINAEPGVLITGAARDLVRTWPALTETRVAGIHYVQEDAPDEIGRAIADWLPALSPESGG